MVNKIEPSLYVLEPTKGAIWSAEKYYHHSGQQKMVAELLIKQYDFKETDEVLDVGCGPGEITRSIADERVPKGKTIGIDPSESMIHFANEHFAKGNRIQFQIGKASELNFRYQFNVVTSFSCLHWEPKQKEALLCFKKALKPGGTILLAIPGPDPVLRSALQEICVLPPWSRFFQGFQSLGRIWTANEYEQLLLETQFTKRKIEVVERPYIFSREEYKKFIEAMLPHMACIPPDQAEEFLDTLVSFVEQQNYIDEFGNIRFTVKVLEVIASSPG